MKNRKFHFLVIFIVSVMKAFTGQYALTHQIVLVDESNYFETVSFIDKDYISEIKDGKTFDFIYENTVFQVVQ